MCLHDARVRSSRKAINRRENERGDILMHFAQHNQWSAFGIEVLPISMRSTQKKKKIKFKDMRKKDDWIPGFRRMRDNMARICYCVCRIRWHLCVVSISHVFPSISIIFTFQSTHLPHVFLYTFLILISKTTHLIIHWALLTYFLNLAFDAFRAIFSSFSLNCFITL